jgi:hypothetical protein
VPSPVFEFPLPCEMKKRRKGYLAMCPSPDVASRGPSKGKALESLGDAMRGVRADCLERKTPEEVLQQADFV